MSDKLEIPDHTVMMVTNRNFRLSSLNGYVVNFKANEPIAVPPHVYEEAVRIGAVMAEDQSALERPKAKTDGGIKGAAEAAELEEAAKFEYIKQACLILIARDDSTEFKADGYPKLNAVTKETPPECPQITAGEVQQVYDELRKNLDLAEVDDE